MSLCEMCGKEENLQQADVAGAEMNVCSNCLKYGSLKKTNKPVIFNKQTFHREEPKLRIVSNYHNILKSSRENRNMSQKEFGRFLQEKEAVVAKWESRVMWPSISIARRLEKTLNIKLVESDVKLTFEQNKKKSENFTLGDFIKVRKRK